MNAMNESQLHPILHKTLESTFGFKEFREGQLQAITTLLTKGAALCILPTGYGKSLLYQLPACVLGGVTIVISPLLALMRDQIEQLNRRFKIPAMAINSDQTDEENSDARLGALRGSIKILFVAPEQLDNVDRFKFLLDLDVKLVVVDEAHCISTWGHDFRPSYRQIVHLLNALHAKNPHIKMLGLTATANQRVEKDIHKQMFSSGKEAIVLRKTMDRPNISLSVLKAKGPAIKLAMCEHLLKKLEGSGLIYCATRENTELVSDYLREQGLNVTSYHAGYDVDEKRRLQKEFENDKYKALTATNALGMGIDKGSLRFIIHFDFPGSITAYYQEVGRCGRDGNKAYGILLYDSSDQKIHEYFIDSALPTLADFDLVLSSVAGPPQPPGLNMIKTLTGLHPTRVTTVIAELIEQGFLIKYSLSGKQVYKLGHKQGKPDLSRYAIQKEVKDLELKQIINYSSQSENCRMHILRTALGDERSTNCGHCDVCRKRTNDIRFDPEKIDEINHWLNQRPVPIAPVIKEKILEGLSILDGKLRSPLFVRFMKQRANCPEDSIGMDDELLDLIKNHLNLLKKKHRIVGLVPIPSKTWQARDQIYDILARHLDVPLLPILEWKDPPHKRQGELLNNNQRNDNVHLRMGVKLPFSVSPGTLILLDDYIGSGNTLKEAARALRSFGLTNDLVPFTVAAVKWHLGKPGFI